MKLALLAPSYAAMPGPEAAGRVQLLCWEGTARDLKLTDVQQHEGSLEQCLAHWSGLLHGVERIICVLPESHAYWFEPEVPFAQRRKLEAVLGSVLEDEWPGEISETEYRFDAVQQSGSIRARTCVVERTTLDAVTAAFAAAGIPLDGLLPAATVLARAAVGDAPHALMYDEHLTVRLLTADGPVWSSWRLPPAADIVEEYALACERAARSLPIQGSDDRTPMLMSLAEVLHLPDNYRPMHVAVPVRAVCDTTLPVEAWSLLALEVIRNSHYMFGSRRRQQNPLAALPISLGPRTLVAAAVAGLCLALGSWMSLHFKRAESQSYKAAADAIFSRAFPGQTPSNNVAKQARALMGGGEAPGTERTRNPGILATMEHIQQAMPSAGAATLEKIDIVGTTWNLAGLCTDFSCVDALKAGLEKAPSAGEVKVNSAKQGVNKDKIKFSLTVKSKEPPKTEASE